MVNGVYVAFFMEELQCVSCWILSHRHWLPGKVIRSRNSSRPTQVSLILGLSLDQDRRRPQVMCLCWLVIAHRDMTLARDTQPQSYKDILPMKPGAATVGRHHPEASWSQQRQQNMATAENTKATLNCKYWTTVKDSHTHKLVSGTFFPAKSSQNFFEPDKQTVPVGLHPIQWSPNHFTKLSAIKYLN